MFILESRCPGFSFNSLVTQHCLDLGPHRNMHTHIVKDSISKLTTKNRHNGTGYVIQRVWSACPPCPVPIKGVWWSCHLSNLEVKLGDQEFKIIFSDYIVLWRPSLLPPPKRHTTKKIKTFYFYGDGGT